MRTLLDLLKIKSYLKENEIDAWLIFDFRGNNPAMGHIIGKKFLTRRNAILIPKEGKSQVLCHIIDNNAFDEACQKYGFEKNIYMTYQELHQKLEKMLFGKTTIAMEYSPKNALPIISYVDAGTIELIKGFGKNIVSSADIFQIASSIWSEHHYNSHVNAAREVNEVKDLAFKFIGENIKNGTTITEYDVSKFIRREFEKRNLYAGDDAIVGVNENSSNCHYEPKKGASKIIKTGDLVLIDLWARYNEYDSVYADITWMGYVGESVPSEYANIFEIVKGARDTAVKFLQDSFMRGQKVQGFMVDRVVREYITNKGFGQYFVHRTGHSMGPGDKVHALGVNLDDFETHDTRYIIPKVGFSVEPGIYLGKFGVRSEIDMYVDENRGPIVTTSMQESIVKIL